MVLITCNMLALVFGESGVGGSGGKMLYIYILIRALCQIKFEVGFVLIMT